MKSGTEFTVQTGWRTWNNRASSEPLTEVNAEPYTFKYAVGSAIESALDGEDGSTDVEEEPEDEIDSTEE